MAAISHLRSFQALELALRTASLTRAAEALAITPAAVGQRIKTLEDYLGVELVVRGRSGLRPAPALSGALPHLTKAFAELGAAADALEFQRVNEIQIAANSDWVELWLLPRIATFRKTHPNMLFCINGEGDAPMRLGRTDVEIRFGADARDENCALLFRDFLMPICSAENAARIGKLKTRFPLEGFPLLHLDFYKDDPAAIGWPEWIRAHGQRKSAPQRGIRFQRIAPGLAAVQSDAGLMICGLALIADRVRAGEFTLPFPVATGAWTGHAFHARFRADSLLWPQVRAFRAWLQEEARATAEALAGIASPSESIR